MIEKRKYPRIDTSGDGNWQIRIYGSKGKPMAGKILNVSVGGVAFESEWKNVSKAIKRNSARVEICMPDGKYVGAHSRLLRIRPQLAGRHCVCVLQLSDMTKRDSNRLQDYLL